MSTILVVDDRPICREFLITLLGYSHHHLLEASDGEQALKIISEELPELIITDLLMPTMNGYELVQKIKTDPVLAKIPVIFYTASFLLDEAKLLADTCDVKHVLFKPSDPQLILDTVNEALNLTNTESVPAHIKEAVAKTQGLSQNNDSSSYHLSELEDILGNFNSAITEMQQFGKEDGRLLKISEQLSHAFNQLYKISNQLMGMSELSLNMISERDPRHLLELCCKSARNILGSKYCFLGILDENNQKLKIVTISGMESDTERKIDILQPDCSLIKQTLGSDHVQILNEIDKKLKNEFPSSHPTINCFLGARFITTSHLYGFIYFVDKSDGTVFNETDSKIASTLASEIAMLYGNIELYDIIQRHAAKLQILMSERDKQDY